MTSVRILLSSHGAGLYGAERVLLALAGGFAGRGHRTTVEVPHPGPLVERLREVPELDLWLSGRPRLPRDVAEGARHLLGAPGAVVRLRRGIRRREPDVVWVNSIFDPLAATAARSLGVPVVWHLHERNFPGPAGYAMGGWIRACAGRAVAVSDYVADSFRRRGVPDRRLRTLGNALLRRPGVVAELPPSGGSFVVGCIGQLEPRKRVPDAVRAIARLPGARLVIVGGGKAREGVRRAVRGCGVEERVRMTGYRDDVFDALAGFHCVAIPAVREPFGLVALEAMAAGRPVVAARSGALPEVLGEAALYHPPGDVGALAARLRRLREDPGLAGELRERGLRRVERFDPERWLDGAEEIAREVAEG